MLSHKQAWRRSRPRTRPRPEGQLRPHPHSHTQHGIARSTSLPETETVASSERASLQLQRSSTVDLGVISRTDKAVRFGFQSSVVLIPSRGEYVKHGVATDIWWSVEDYLCFKACAILDVMDILEHHKGNVISALTALYQTPKLSISPKLADVSTTSPCNKGDKFTMAVGAKKRPDSPMPTQSTFDGNVSATYGCNSKLHHINQTHQSSRPMHSLALIVV